MTTDGSRPQGSATEPAWSDAWASALDALELDVAAAEELLRTAHLTRVEDVAVAAAWRPPSDLGPLPAGLQVRAQMLLDRQLDVARRTSEALTRNRRHLAATDALRYRPAHVPVYVDADF